MCTKVLLSGLLLVGMIILPTQYSNISVVSNVNVDTQVQPILTQKMAINGKFDMLEEIISVLSQTEVFIFNSKVNSISLLNPKDLLSKS